MRLATALGLLLLGLGYPLPSAADDRFDAAAARAERLEDLRTFLGNYVGSCPDPIERRACEAKVAAFRKAAGAKTYVVRVTEAAPLIRTQPKGSDRFVLLFTPLVDGGGYGLSRGEPKRLDAGGNPVVDLVPLEARLPPGVLEMEFLSPFRSGAIDLEIVFRPERAWKLKPRGEPKALEGLAARFLALRVLDARKDTEIAARTW